MPCALQGGAANARCSRCMSGGGAGWQATLSHIWYPSVQQATLSLIRYPSVRQATLSHIWYPSVRQATLSHIWYPSVQQATLSHIRYPSVQQAMSLCLTLGPKETQHAAPRRGERAFCTPLKSLELGACLFFAGTTCSTPTRSASPA